MGPLGDSVQAIAREAGIDLIISGHKHEQKVDSLAMWPFSFVRRNVVWFHIGVLFT